MRFLPILLLFCPLVFSHGEIDDYFFENRDYNPEKCIFQAREAIGGEPYKLNRTITEEQLEVAHRVIKQCMSVTALFNKKVQEDGEQLVKKVYSAFKFKNYDMVKCRNKWWTHMKEFNCSTFVWAYAPATLCTWEWGGNGCLIKVFRQYCGQEFVDRFREKQLFDGLKGKECVDMYSHL